MIPFALSLSKPKAIIAIVAVIVLCISHGYVFVVGKKVERASWQEIENKRLIDTAVLVLKNQKDNLEKERAASNAHQIELSAIRNRYELNNKRLRYTTTAKCDPSGMPESSAGTDAAITRNVELPKEISENLWRLARDADEVTAVARGLQELNK